MATKLEPETVLGRSDRGAEAPESHPEYVRDVAWAQRRVTFLGTLRLLRSDYQRMADQYRFPLTRLRAVQMTILPSIIALIIFRFSHYFYVHNFGVGAWFLYTLNHVLTGFDAVPRTRIGERCLLGHTVATILSGQIGHNATIFARAGTGGGRDMVDVGAGPGLPVIGDNVTLGVNCSVMGSLFIGDGAFVGAHSMVIIDVPPNAVVAGVPAVVKRVRTDAPQTAAPTEAVEE